MDNALEFILNLRDQLTPGIKAAQTAADASTVRIAQDLQHVGHSAEGAGFGVKKLEGALEMLKETMIPIFGAFAAFEFLKDSVSEFSTQDQAIAQMESTLKSTKGAVGLTSEALKQQAEELQKTTLFTDDATIKMQSLLLTFTNVKGAIFTQAIPAIQDLATKMGGDLQGAAVQVGKALNDPIQGINALRRVGVSFSESQRDVITKLVETGHRAEAQALILKELNTEFGGSAEAAAKAGTGPFTQLAHRFDDVKKKVGEVIVQIGIGLMPVLNLLVTAFDGVIEGAKEVYHWMQEHKEIMGIVAIALGAAVAVYIVYTTYTKIAAAATFLWAGAQMVLNAAFWANPITWIVAGIIALVAIITYAVYTTDGWGKQWDSVVKFMKFTWAGFKEYFNIVWLSVEDTFMSGIELIEKGWYHLKSLWDEEGAKAGLNRINDQQNARANEIAQSKGLLQSDMDQAQAALKWELHGNGKTMGTVVADLKKTLGIGGPKGVNAASAGVPGAGATKAGEGLGDIGKTKADSINSGGQRSVVINIGKQIEKLEVHVMNAKEGAQEIESAVRDALRRVLYSANGAVTN